MTEFFNALPTALHGLVFNALLSVLLNIYQLLVLPLLYQLTQHCSYLFMTD